MRGCVFIEWVLDYLAARVINSTIASIYALIGFVCGPDREYRYTQD